MPRRRVVFLFVASYTRRGNVLAPGCDSWEHFP